MPTKRTSRKARPRKSKKASRKSLAPPSAKTLDRLRQNLLLSAPKDPEELAPEVGRALREELLRYSPALPKED